eukprot:462705-Pelagomonas_calceolata.AAC.1
MAFACIAHTQALQDACALLAAHAAPYLGPAQGSSLGSILMCKLHPTPSKRRLNAIEHTVLFFGGHTCDLVVWIERGLAQRQEIDGCQPWQAEEEKTKIEGLQKAA